MAEQKSPLVWLNELCQYLGHGSPRFFRDSDFCWAVEVPLGPPHGTRVFVSKCMANDSIAGRKVGRHAAAEIAFPILVAMEQRRELASSGASGGERVGASPAQTLYETANAYGWGTRFFKDDETGVWAVEVCRGASRQVFASDDTSFDSIKGRKIGHRAAAEAALAGLEDAVRLEKCMRQMSLADVITPHFRQHVRVCESNDATWDVFWADPPHVVGVDVEGNQQHPPCLVQVATPTLVILEAPSRRGPVYGMSPNLKRLLADKSIVKVFCDSTQRDRQSLGMTEREDEHDELLRAIRGLPAPAKRADVVELESIASEHIGASPSARGLARIFSAFYSAPKAQIRVFKPDDGATVRFQAIEQGLAPQLNGVDDLTDEEREYAAIDAWVTLVTWAHVDASMKKAEPPRWSLLDSIHGPRPRVPRQKDTK
jgi:hypothetical protein